MVTQLYTAPIRPYHQRVQPKPQKHEDTQSAEQSLNTDSSGNRQPSSSSSSSSTLAALNDQSQNGVISIQAILSDFESTMNALGVSNDVRNEVSPYLQVVASQSQKAQPNTPLMKQNLRAASDTLDQFITQALGQPSKVVKEWMDALLIQNIQYQSDSPIQLQTGAYATGLSTPAVQATLNKDELKAWFHQASLLVKNGDTPAAITQYQNILKQLPTQPVSPLHIKVWMQLGQLSQQNQQPDQAKLYYQQVQQVAESLNKPELTIKSALALSQVAYSQGQLEDAQSTLEKALLNAKELAPQYVGSLLNHLGQVSRKQGQNQLAFSYYKQAMQASSAHKNADTLQTSLNGLASVYLDAGHADKAFKVLQKAVHLRQA